jgi:hypothetical protein
VFIIWWESLKERDHFKDQGVGGNMGSEWILGRLAWGVWIGFDWLRTDTGVGLLWVQWWTFGFLHHGVSYCRKKDMKPESHNALKYASCTHGRCAAQSYKEFALFWITSTDKTLSYSFMSNVSRHEASHSDGNTSLTDTVSMYEPLN